MEISYDRNFRGNLEIVFQEDDYLEVMDVLLTEWSAESRERIQTVDQLWHDLSIEGSIITLHTDGMAGCCLISRDRDDEELLRRIGDSLNNRKRSG